MCVYIYNLIYHTYIYIFELWVHSEVDAAQLNAEGALKRANGRANGPRQKPAGASKDGLCPCIAASHTACNVAGTSVQRRCSTAEALISLLHARHSASHVSCKTKLRPSGVPCSMFDGRTLPHSNVSTFLANWLYSSVITSSAAGPAASERVPHPQRP